MFGGSSSVTTLVETPRCSSGSGASPCRVTSVYVSGAWTSRVVDGLADDDDLVHRRPVKPHCICAMPSAATKVAHVNEAVSRHRACALTARHAGDHRDPERRVDADVEERAARQLGRKSRGLKGLRLEAERRRHRHHLADRAVGDELAHRARRREEARPHPLHQEAPLLARLRDAPLRLRRDHHRLLARHVLAPRTASGCSRSGRRTASPRRRRRPRRRPPAPRTTRTPSRSRRRLERVGGGLTRRARSTAPSVLDSASEKSLAMPPVERTPHFVGMFAICEV